MCVFPMKVKQGDVLPSCFSCHLVNKCPFQDLFNDTVFAFLLILLFTVVPKCSTHALSHVPKQKEGCDVPNGENNCVR